MKTLTATNQRVQFYLTYTTARPTTEIKRKRLNALKQSLEERNVMLDELFPRKQRDVLDHILYITSASGISKVGTDKLAERCDVSEGTVWNAVSRIKTLTDDFVVGRLEKSTGGLGKYIFVDKKHPNFREIMREVFSISDYKFKQLFEEPFVERNLTESLDTTSVEGENRSSNSIISLSFKTRSKNNIYLDNKSEKEAIKESIDREATLNLDEQR